MCYNSYKDESAPVPEKVEDKVEDVVSGLLAEIKKASDEHNISADELQKAHDKNNNNYKTLMNAKKKLFTYLSQKDLIAR